MRLVDYSLIILDQNPGLEGINQQIELAGRTCYKSEDKITEGSAKKFVDMMIKSGHGAMLEHGTVYLKNLNTSKHELSKYVKNKYSSFKETNKHLVNLEQNLVMLAVDEYVTTNLRVLVENNWLDDLKYLCEPTEVHEKRITVKFTTGIDITREYNRHRVDSMAEQSTRYCNYTKDKFGNEISVMLPRQYTREDITNVRKLFSDTPEDDFSVFKEMCLDIYNNDGFDFADIDVWLFAHLSSEWAYFQLIDKGWKAQDARKVLCLDTQSELVHTAFVSDWKHFLSLRSPKYGATGVHPDAAYLADMLYDTFRDRNILE